jgi:hypothetical protein
MARESTFGDLVGAPYAAIGVLLFFPCRNFTATMRSVTDSLILVKGR